MELRPTGYQFPTPPPLPPEAGDFDANWLQIAGEVRTASGQGWTFEQPCLQTSEARKLGDWLRLAAAHGVPITSAPTEESPGVLRFVEPNLGFSIAAHHHEALVVRVHLSHSSTPDLPWPKECHHDQTLYGLSTLTLPLHATGPDVLAAARAWDDELAAFPHRPADP